MIDTREKRAKCNIATSLLYQFVMMVSGVIVPRLFITNFGSEIYGATTSIGQFLGYIVLLEGGIGAIARAVLYKPLADNNIEKISAVLSEIKRFFMIVGCIFGVYVAVLACCFQSISHIKVLDWTSTCLLVIAISISTFTQYFIGISNAVLIQASQKSYVTNIINIVGTVLNVVVIVIFINSGYNIIVVRLASSVAFTIRPVLQWLYVKKNYALRKTKRQKDVLENKWTGIGQHIAYFLHTHTDVLVLTLFSNLLLVAVYSVYNMVISAIQNIVVSFSTGMEALFGDMYARKEKQLLNKTFSEYETLISCIAIVLFSTTIVMVTPFIKLYTNGITDVNYIQPTFGVVLSIAAILFCMRSPYHSMVTAAGHFKQTRWAAYGEAVINIIMSITLVKQFGLIGVAIGTVCATAFRFTYYAVYLSKNILNRNIGLWFKRLGVNAGLLTCIVFISNFAIKNIEIENYFCWTLASAGVFFIAMLISFVGYFFFYNEDIRKLLHRFVKRKGADAT